MADQMMKAHKLQIRNKPGSEGELSKGANTEVLLDGKPLRGVTFIKYEAKAAGLNKIMFEMFAEVDVDVNVELPQKELKGTAYRKSNGKALALYQMGSFEPKEVVSKVEDPSCSSAGSKPYCDSCACGKKAAFEKKEKTE